MSKVSFDNFGVRANTFGDHTLVAGRGVGQREAERCILPDILHKLDIRPDDDCLDIGCGTGNLLIPMSFFVASVTGIDHPSCIEKFERRFPSPSNVRLLAGNFLDTAIAGRFHKVIAYSVLHYLRNADEVFSFVDKAISLAMDGGRILLGDIPNESRKARFLQTSSGQVFEADWRRKQAIAATGKISEPLLVPDSELVKFDDDLVLAMIHRARKMGCHAYVLPQHPMLPFGYTREDILIEKLA